MRYREVKEQTDGAYMAIMATCSASTVIPGRETDRTLRLRSVENVHRQKKAAHTTPEIHSTRWVLSPRKQSRA